MTARIRRRTALLGAAAICFAAIGSAGSGAAPEAGSVPAYGYTELAEMALTAPLVIAADVARATALKGDAAAGVRPGMTRYYVEADVRALVSGGASLPPRVSYLVDLPQDGRGRKPTLKGMPVLLLAATTGTPGALRLIGPRAQVPRTADNEARLRAILTATVAPDAPPAITGVGRAFHVAGSLPGESETQIFLRTADARPISLSILRRPGAAPRWAVALTEMVDDSAAPPPRESLLWYRLACGLPAVLPGAALAGLADEDAAAARADYRVVLDGLGPCGRADQKDDSSTPTPAQSG